eukprot:gene7226-8395_t
MSDVFASPKSQVDGADFKNNKGSSNSNTSSPSTSSFNISGHGKETPRWSVLHNRMKCAAKDDKMDPLKRGSILIEHLSEIHKLAASQVILGEEEQTSEHSNDTEEAVPVPCIPSDAMVLSGIELFNEKPRKGVDFFITNRLLERTPVSVAEFLHTCPLLNKKSIGDYLGDSDQFSISTLEAFIARFNFQDLDFDMALRQLLYCFRLPGEAQKIDRIVQKFANQFYQDNIKSGIFEDPDAVYILAFAIILLNTDGHSPAIKPTMTKPKFIKSLARINNGKDLPVDFVEDLFDRISADEIKMDPAAAQFPYAVKKGWLNIRVKGKVTEKWSRKWCILSEGSLYFFRKPTDVTPTRFLHPDTVITPKKEVKGKKYCFMLNHSSPPLLLELLNANESSSKKSNNKPLSSQYIYQQMLILSNKEKPRPPRFWDSVTEKVGDPLKQRQLAQLEAMLPGNNNSGDIGDTDSVSSVDTLSESSSAYYDEDISLSSSSSISSSTSSSPNSPLSTSSQPHGQFLHSTDPKKKGFSLRFGKQKKEQLANLQENSIPNYPHTTSTTTTTTVINNNPVSPNSFTHSTKTQYLQGWSHLSHSLVEYLDILNSPQSPIDTKQWQPKQLWWQQQYNQQHNQFTSHSTLFYI